MPDRPHAVRRFLWRAARNVLFLVVIAVGGLLFYGSTAGIPECLLQRVLARLNQGSFAIDISGARLAGLAQLEVSDLSLFRKRVLGAPLLESPTATIALSPLA